MRQRLGCTSIFVALDKCGIRLDSISSARSADKLEKTSKRSKQKRQLMTEIRDTNVNEMSLPQNCRVSLLEYRQHYQNIGCTHKSSPCHRKP